MTDNSYPINTWLTALQYILTRPGMLDGLPGGPEPLLAIGDARIERLLTATANTPHELQTLIDGRRSYKVGPAFEALVQYALVHGLGYECLAWDLQIFEKKRTVGALDLVLRSQSGAIEHWELAYKLYLQSGQECSWEHWVGPNEHDRLSRKVSRLLEHQLPLSNRPEARDALQRIDIDRIDIRRAFLMGTLFHHWQSPPALAHDAMHESEGWWVHLSDLSNLVQSYPGSRWSRRYKPHWFGVWDISDRGLSVDDLQEELRVRPLTRPQLWVMGPVECRPVFLVPNTWGQRP